MSHVIPLDNREIRHIREIVELVRSAIFTHRFLMDLDAALLMVEMDHTTPKAGSDLHRVLAIAVSWYVIANNLTVKVGLREEDFHALLKKNLVTISIQRKLAR